MYKNSMILIRAAIVLLIISFLFPSCRRDSYHVDISGIKANIKIKRLEHDLFKVSPGDLEKRITLLKSEYGTFLQLFSYVINIGETEDSAWSANLLNFCTDKQNYEVFESTESVFPDISWIEDGMNEAFRHYSYYFPGKGFPQVYTCITGFNNSLIILKDSVLAIGLDRYLGSGSKYYPMLRIYGYQAAKMNPSNILPDAMYGWASVEWEFNETGYDTENVLSDMIHEGKLMYFVKCMLPAGRDELIFGFTEDQMKFCRNNESQMWQYLVENNLLFSSDQLTRRKLTGEAPYTGYFTRESPGRAAVWIGFRIVESYMKNKKDATLADLMTETDVQSILEGARYSPR